MSWIPNSGWHEDLLGSLLTLAQCLRLLSEGPIVLVLPLAGYGLLPEHGYLILQELHLPRQPPHLLPLVPDQAIAIKSPTYSSWLKSLDIFYTQKAGKVSLSKQVNRMFQTKSQCCGSGMFHSDPRYDFFPSQIPDPNCLHLGSWIPDPHHLNILTQKNQKNGFHALENMIRVVHPGSGVKKAPDPGSGSATLLKTTTGEEHVSKPQQVKSMFQSHNRRRACFKATIG
jgi:hypothetical protein